MKGAAELVPRYDAARGRVWDLVAISGAGRPDKWQRAAGAAKVSKARHAGVVSEAGLAGFLETQRARGRRIACHEMPGGFCLYSIFGERHPTAANGGHHDHAL